MARRRSVPCERSLTRPLVPPRPLSPPLDPRTILPALATALTAGREPRLAFSAPPPARRADSDPNAARTSTQTADNACGASGAEHDSPAHLGIEWLAAQLDLVVRFATELRAHVHSLGPEARAVGRGGSGATPAEAGAARPLTSTEAADWLQVTADTVNAWCCQGRFPNARSLGRAGWRIPRCDLEALQLDMPSRGARRQGRRHA